MSALDGEAQKMQISEQTDTKLLWLWSIYCAYLATIVDILKEVAIWHGSSPKKKSFCGRKKTIPKYFAPFRVTSSIRIETFLLLIVRYILQNF